MLFYALVRKMIYLSTHICLQIQIWVLKWVILRTIVQQVCKMNHLSWVWNIDALASLMRQPYETNGSFTHELDTLFFITSAHKTQFHSENKQGGRKSI